MGFFVVEAFLIFVLFFLIKSKQIRCFRLGGKKISMVGPKIT